MSTSADLVMTAVYLTRAQHTALKALAAQTHVSMAVYIRGAVTKLLAEQARKSRDRQGEVT